MTVQVSFYQESNVTSYVRTAEFQLFSTDSLVFHVKQSMQSTEKFACFRSPDGRVVAVNQTGEYIIL